MSILSKHLAYLKKSLHRRSKFYYLLNNVLIEIRMLYMSYSRASLHMRFGPFHLCFAHLVKDLNAQFHRLHSILHKIISYTQ